MPFPKDTLASIEPSAAQERCPIPRTMDRIRGGGWCLLVLVAETMSMRRGVPGGLRMAPAEAHDALGLIPLQFAGARGEWPRPRIP